MVTIKLKPDDLEYVYRVAHEVAQRRQNHPENAMAHKRTYAENLAYNQRAYAAELAVAIYTDGVWFSHYGGPGGFDVSPYIEVRNTTPGRNLYIKAREFEPGDYEKPPYTRYFLTYSDDDPGTVKIVGWLPLYEALEHLRPHEHNGRLYGYTVAADLLWPASSYPNRP